MGYDRDILLSNSLRYPLDTRLGQRIVDLPSISVHTTRTRDVDDTPRFSILDPEVRCCGANDLEGCRRVQVDNGMPLLVGHLVDYAVPCISRVVDDDVDLPAAKLSRLGDERLDVVVVKYVARHRDGATAGPLDGCDYGFSFLWVELGGYWYPSVKINVPASTSAITTFAPSFANSFAASAPIPWPEPVMIAVWPANIPLG
jgi:hypothetical protein